MTWFDCKHDPVNTVLPKSIGEWLTDFLIQLDEKPLSNGIKKFLKNEAVERVKYVSHNIVLRLFLPLQVPKRREVKKMINLGFWETAHLPLPYAIIIAYFSLRAKCWLRGGVGGQFPQKPKESVAVALWYISSR